MNPTMSVPAPHFLLYCDADSQTRGSTAAIGQWRFVLESEDGGSRLEAADVEPETDSERLALLAAVRGLEALDQPSTVTLVTRNAGLSRGLRFGLTHWRDNDWRWERFGRRVPIKNADLWRRVDQALQFHDLRCRIWRLDAPHRPQLSGAEGTGFAQSNVVSRHARRSTRRLLGGLLAAVWRGLWRLVTLPGRILIVPLRREAWAV